jgi:SAM-dependent methyltransferase
VSLMGEPERWQHGVEEFSDPGPFDYVVASLSLHHIEDLGSALEKIANLLQAGGTLVVVEFAWDRLDEATTGPGLVPASLFTQRRGRSVPVNSSRLGSTYLPFHCTN